MNLRDIEQFLQKIPSLKFLVVGDLILDRYVWGAAERISPEAPIPVVHIKNEESRLGGAGNVVNNLATLGCGVRLASVVGQDADGTTLQHLLRQQQVQTDGVLVEGGRQTTCKTRILANHQQMLRLDREDCGEINLSQEKQLLEHIQRIMSDVDAVLISDYRKGVLTDNVLTEVIRFSSAAGCPVIVDPKGTDFSRYRGATVLTPNRKELEIASGITVDGVDSLNTAGTLLRKSADLAGLLVTRGGEGMTLFQGDKVSHLPTDAREVFDVSGAGDTVLAFYAAGLANGFTMLESAKLANMAAGIVVGKVGTSTVSPSDLLTAGIFRHRVYSSNIVKPDQLSVILQNHHQSGKKVVFTNGCFDLLHAGHVKYLQRARELGDVLVLGLNSDESVRRLKGEKRPLLKQGERAQILAALDCVDYVTIFDEDTPIELICQLRPDILAKGGDYAAAEVVGREYVESYGGRLELLEFENGKSTTNIIDEVLTRYRD